MTIIGAGIGPGSNIRTKPKAWLALFLALMIHSAQAEDQIELETTTIRGNKELPKILYLIPWKEIKRSKSNEGQELVLHSLFGNLFEPMAPEYSDQHSGNMSISK